MKGIVALIAILVIAGSMCGCVDKEPEWQEIELPPVEDWQIIEEPVEEIISCSQPHNFVQDIVGYDTTVYKNTASEDVTTSDIVEVVEYMYNPTSIITEAYEEGYITEGLNEVEEIETIEDMLEVFGI